MNRESFEPLADDATVFRLVEYGTKFLPPGARLPTLDLFEPTTRDKAQAKERGREPGVSVWDRSLTSVPQATTIRYARGTAPDDVRAFGLVVGEIRTVSHEYEREVDVVTDPLEEDRGPGAEGHSAIEGLKRPDGYQRKRHKAFLLDLADACSEME